MAHQRKLSLSISVLVALFLVCALTNPTKQEHLQALGQKNTITGGVWEIASALGGVSYNNYVICSTLSDPKGANLTFGILKNVFPLGHSGKGR